MPTAADLQHPAVAQQPTAEVDHRRRVQQGARPVVDNAERIRRAPRLDVARDRPGIGDLDGLVGEDSEPAVTKRIVECHDHASVVDRVSHAAQQPDGGPILPPLGFEVEGIELTAVDGACRVDGDADRAARRSVTLGEDARRTEALSGHVAVHQADRHVAAAAVAAGGAARKNSIRRVSNIPDRHAAATADALREDGISGITSRRNRRVRGADGHRPATAGVRLDRGAGAEQIDTSNIAIMGVGGGGVAGEAAAAADALGNDAEGTGAGRADHGAGVQRDGHAPTIAAGVTRARGRDVADVEIGSWLRQESLTADHGAAATADRLRQDAVRIQARGGDGTAGGDLDGAAGAGGAVLAAEGQRQPLQVGDPPLRVADELGRVERFVGGHCADQAAAAADALREDGDAVLAGCGDGAAAIAGGDGDRTAIAGGAAIAADADRQALERAADDARHGPIAAAAADALRDDAEGGDTLGQD